MDVRFQVPETVNWHLWPRCNMRCSFCFERFEGYTRRDVVPFDVGCRLLAAVAKCGVRRVNFSGGEPTLCPDLASYAKRARDLGMQTSIVTNGKNLTESLMRSFDVIALSIDSTHRSTLERSGRFDAAIPDYPKFILNLARRIRALGIELKINVVVTRFNVDEDMSGYLRELAPRKIKFLQFTEVIGENDRNAADLRITADEFHGYVARNRVGIPPETWVEAEDERTMNASYVMIDPSGRVFQVNDGRHRMSRSIVEIGLQAAMRDVGGYDRELFLARGGDRDLLASRPTLTIEEKPC